MVDQVTAMNGSEPSRASLWREVIRLAVPTWGAFIAHDLMGLVDMFFVGKLGPEAVAAVGISGVLFGIVIMIGHGVSTGTMTIVSVAVGSGQTGKAGRAVAQGLHLALFMSLLVAVGGWIWCEPMLKALGAAPEVVAPGATYLRIVALGSLPMMWSMLLGSSLRGAGQVRLPFRAMVMANVINAVLDPVMIFGLGGFPRMGVAGSAMATVVGRVVGMAIMATSLLPAAGVEVRSTVSRTAGRLRLHWHDLAPDLRLALEIVRMGIFASGRMMVQNISQIVLMRIVAGFGTAAVAAFGIGLRLQMIVFAPSMGFGVSAATLVGQYLGAGDLARARRASWTAVAGAFMVASLIGMGVGFAAVPAIRLFNADAEVIRIGAPMLRWMCIGFPFIAMMFVLGSGMGGGGDTFSPLVMVALNSFGIRLPGAWWLSRGVLGVVGVWVGLAVSSVTGALLSLIFFERGRWRRTGRRIRKVVSSEGLVS